MNDDDLIAAGFERLHSNLIEKRPPPINWGMLYQEKSDEEKIKYLEKLSASMNRAASLIQDERNQLVELCSLKEGQLEQMAEAVRANNDMLQSEVTRMNEQRQFYNAEVARLTSEIRELKNGNNT